jgi:long-chain acyl-CoA synthetase
VKYWDILDEDFTMANELLTPTLKIRRKAIYQRYGDRFEALYQMAAAGRAAPA